MGGVVGNGSSGIGRNNFASCSYVEGWRRVREACSWQGCMFSSSKASHVNDHFRLLKISRRITARENMECILCLVRFSGICFSGILGVMVLENPVSIDIVFK